MRRALMLAAVLWLAPLTAYAAPILIVDDAGQLLGAKGVNVGSLLYDVDFLDGSCIALFDGCDRPDDFAFQTLDAALLASQSLLEQVFVDGPLGLFDSRPDLTNGCLPQGPLGSCVVMTPFHEIYPLGSFSAVFASDYSLASQIPDTVTAGLFNEAIDTRFLANGTYARWAPVESVPEPASLALVGTALFGLALRRRPFRFKGQLQRNQFASPIE